MWVIRAVAALHAGDGDGERSPVLVTRRNERQAVAASQRVGGSRHRLDADERPGFADAAEFAKGVLDATALDAGLEAFLRLTEDATLVVHDHGEGELQPTETPKTGITAADRTDRVDIVTSRLRAFHVRA